MAQPPALALSRTVKPKKTVRFAPDTKDVDTYAISARKYRRASAHTTVPKPTPPAWREVERVERVREEAIVRARVSHMSRSWMY